MIFIFRPWQSRLSSLLVAVLTLGLVRLDEPRVYPLRKMRFPHRWWLALEARYHGRRDGKIGIPRPDEATAPPEIWKLKQHGDGVVRDLAATWSATDARLAGEHNAIERTVHTVDGLVDRLKPEFKTLKDRADARRKRLLEMKNSDEKRHAEDRWRIPTWFYVIAITLIFAGEFPLNAVAFNLFGEDRVSTYTMTAGMAAVLVFCAHSLGILWRRRAMTDRDLIVTLLLTLLPVAVVVAIAVVRENYREALNRAGGGLAVLSPMMGVVIFVTMNLVIYLGAFALSYLHHDPDGEMIERVEREVRKAERATKDKQREIDRALAAKQYLLTKLALWQGGREKAHRHAAFQGKRHKDLFESFMQAYWGSNRLATERAFRKLERRARRRGEAPDPAALQWSPPRSLETPPEVKLPDEFMEDMLERLFATHSAVSNGNKVTEAKTPPLASV
jgi:hypothetical protein